MKLRQFLANFFISVLVLIIWSGSSMAEQQFSEFTLDNGLKVFFVPDKGAPLVSVRTYVRAGSVDEGELLGSGMSHYLEHLVAGGTSEKRDENSYKDTLSKLGGAYNAYTTTDHTSYFINTVPQHLNEALDVIYEWMFYCKFTDDEFKRERDVIIKEIEKNLANLNRQFYQACQINFYKFHPLRLPVIGYLENFKKVSKEDLVGYYKEKYLPSNMILVVGGNFDEEETLAHIRNSYGTEAKVAPPKTELLVEPPPFTQRWEIEEGPTNVTYLSMRFSTVDLFSRDLYPLDLMEYIVSNGADSPFYKSLVEEKKLAYSVEASSYTPSVTTGYFDITLKLDIENKDKAIAEILKLINDVKQGKFSEKEMEKARKQKIAEDILSIDSIEDKVSRVGQAYMYGYSPKFFETYVSKFKTVKKQDIVRVAQNYFDEDLMIVTVLKPSEEKKETKTSSAKKTNKIAAPTLKTLKNGVRVLFYKDRSLPRVHAKIFTLGGVRSENSSNNGIGNLVGDLLGRGSRRYSKDKILELVEGNGAHLSASVGNNTLFYSLDCLSEDFKTLFPVMIDSYLNPVFEDSEIEIAKRRIDKVIDQREDDWFGASMYQFKKSFYGNHPYAFSPIGEKKTVKAINKKDLNNYISQSKDPKQMVISIFGEFDENEIFKSIESAFSDLKTPASSFDAFQKISRDFHKGSSSQRLAIQQDVAAVFIAYDGLDYSDPKALVEQDLLDSVLSGMSYPSGRMHNNLRGEGMVYMVHGTAYPGLEPGYILFYALTSKDKVDRVLEIMNEQIDDIKSNVVSEEEFQAAIAQMDFNYKDRMSSLDSLTVITSTDELYGRGFDFYLKMEDYLGKLKKEDVQKAAKKYLVNPQIYIFEKKEEPEPASK